MELVQELGDIADAGADLAGDLSRCPSSGGSQIDGGASRIDDLPQVLRQLTRGYRESILGGLFESFGVIGESHARAQVKMMGIEDSVFPVHAGKLVQSKGGLGMNAVQFRPCSCLGGERGME